MFPDGKVPPVSAGAKPPAVPPKVPPGGFGGSAPPGPGGFGGQPGFAQMQAIARTGGGFKGGGFPIPPGGFGGVNGFPVPGGNFGGGFQGGFGGFGGGFKFGGGLGGFQGLTFSGIEGPVARVIVGAPVLESPVAVPKVPLAERPELKLDTEVNERIRRKDVHAHLAKVGIVRPDHIKNWLFREVLHADLDDPKLGLGAMLNENYPFADEDAALERTGRKK
jgi:hypothetical protein